MSYDVGDIVAACAGRDSNKMFVVYGIIDENYVHIVNGKNRTIGNPKRKKIKHIVHVEDFRFEADGFAEKLRLGRLTDASVRRILNEYRKAYMPAEENNGGAENN